MARIVQMSSHGIATPPPPEGRVVVSHLTSGESQILSLYPALKLVLEGEEIHEVDGRPLVLRPGRFLLVDVGSPYRTVVRRSQQTTGLCVYLPRALADPACGEPILDRALVQAADATTLGRRLTDWAVRLHRLGALESLAEEVVSDLSALLPDALATAASALESLTAQKASTRRGILLRLEYARAHLHSHLERVVSLQELATVAGMSTFHLARYFCEAYGAPPARYHRSLRLEHAGRRLKREEASATQVALDCGYGQLSAFTHAFRRHFGYPPSSAVA